MTNEVRAGLLSSYRASPQRLRDSVSGASMAQLDGAPPEPGWTARTIVHHISDIAVMGGLRLRLMLLDIEVELWPTDQDAMQVRLGNDRRAITPALKAVDGLVDSAASILESLSEEEWTQPRPYPGNQSTTVEQWLENNARHIDGHIEQIRYALTGTC